VRYGRVRRDDPEPSIADARLSSPTSAATAYVERRGDHAATELLTRTGRRQDIVATQMGRRSDGGRQLTSCIVGERRRRGRPGDRRSGFTGLAARQWPDPRRRGRPRWGDGRDDRRVRRIGGQSRGPGLSTAGGEVLVPAPSAADAHGPPVRFVPWVAEAEGCRAHPARVEAAGRGGSASTTRDERPGARRLTAAIVRRRPWSSSAAGRGDHDRHRQPARPRRRHLRHRPSLPTRGPASAIPASNRVPRRPAGSRPVTRRARPDPPATRAAVPARRRRRVRSGFRACAARCPPGPKRTAPGTTGSAVRGGCTGVQPDGASSS
jgi:hypothetical protein